MGQQGTLLVYPIRKRSKAMGLFHLCFLFGADKEFSAQSYDGWKTKLDKNLDYSQVC